MCVSQNVQEKFSCVICDTVRDAVKGSAQRHCVLSISAYST